MIDLSKLQELAKKATKGPFLQFTGQRGLYADRKHGPKAIATFATGNRHDSEKTPTLGNLAYFAALPPDVVLALLSVVRAVRVYLDAYDDDEASGHDISTNFHALRESLTPFQGGPNE